MKIKRRITIDVEVEYEEGFTSEALNVLECIEIDTQKHIKTYIDNRGFTEFWQNKYLDKIQVRLTNFDSF